MTEKERDLLIENNIKLCQRLITRYSNLFWRLDYVEIKSIAYFALFNASRSFKAEMGTKFSTYAHRCIQLQIIRLADRTKTNELEFDDTILQEDAEKDIKQLENRILLEQLSEDLTEREREILNKYYYEGYNLEEIAELRGCCYQNVQQAIARAKNKLRKKAIL